MFFKPFAFGISLAVTTETIVHKEQVPHPVHEHILQDPVTGAVNMYQISGSTIIKVIPATEARLVTKSFLEV